MPCHRCPKTEMGATKFSTARRTQGEPPLTGGLSGAEAHRNRDLRVRRVDGLRRRGQFGPALGRSPSPFPDALPAGSQMRRWRRGLMSQHSRAHPADPEFLYSMRRALGGKGGIRHFCLRRQPAHFSLLSAIADWRSPAHRTRRVRPAERPLVDPSTSKPLRDE